MAALLAQVQGDLKLVKHWAAIELLAEPVPHLRGAHRPSLRPLMRPGVPVEGRAEEVVVAVRASEAISPARFSHFLTALRCHAFTLAVVDADSTVSYYKARSSCAPRLMPAQIHDTLVSAELPAVPPAL